MSFQFDISRFRVNVDYARPVAQIRVLEKELLPLSKYVRMLEHESWQNTINEVRGTPYAELLTGVTDLSHLEVAISQVFHSRCEQLYKLILEKNLIRAFRIREDFMNLSIILKSILLEKERRVSLSRDGTVAPDMLEQRMHDREILPAPLNDVFLQALGDYEKNINIPRMDMLIQKIYIGFLANALSESDIPFLKSVMDYYIDRVRISHVIRWRHWGDTDAANRNPLNTIDLNLLPDGGTLPDDKIKALIHEDFSQIPSLFQYTPYTDVFSEGEAGLQDISKIWILEKLLDDLLSEMFKLTKYTAFGVEPLITFLWFSYLEYKNMKIILTGKYMHVDSEDLKNRVRIAYE